MSPESQDRVAQVELDEVDVVTQALEQQTAALVGQPVEAQVQLQQEDILLLSVCPISSSLGVDLVVRQVEQRSEHAVIAEQLGQQARVVVGVLLWDTSRCVSMSMSTRCHSLSWQPSKAGNSDRRSCTLFSRSSGHFFARAFQSSPSRSPLNNFNSMALRRVVIQLGLYTKIYSLLYALGAVSAYW